ncbi:MAG TPA: DUF4112 domain-containing protein [Gemmatimonadaceae bacterium]
MSRTNPRVVLPSENARAIQVGDRTKRVRMLGKLLDNSISIPGTGWKIGLDPIIGLIPGVGDLIGAVLSGYIILEAARAEVPAFTLARMLVNVGIDTLVGAVPALGDVFDAAWKSNTKNVALLERHLSSVDEVTLSGAKRSSSVGAIIVALLVLVAIVGAGLALGIFVARLLWNMNTR